MTQKLRADVVIAGAGFGGILLATALRRSGLNVLLLEKKSHPRFQIGESSTPLANLYLELLCDRFALAEIKPLCKYGSWQDQHPNLPCGLKRGTSLFSHEPGQAFQPEPNNRNLLLVAASPNEHVADTHWLRADFDSFLLENALAAGVAYLDRFEILAAARNSAWSLSGRRLHQAVQIQADFLIDAAAGNHVLQRATRTLPARHPTLTRSWAMYGHFRDVLPFASQFCEAGGATTGHPFAMDQAAVHHIFNDAWLWALRFNNGITSAGLVFHGVRDGNSVDARKTWQETLGRYPSLAHSFRNATTIQPLQSTGPLQFRLDQLVGERFARLPAAAAFIDPFLSTGIALNLKGVLHLAEALSGSLSADLSSYATATNRDIDHVDRLIAGCYAAFSSPQLLWSYLMYYFAGAIHAEHRIRNGAFSHAHGYLSCDLKVFNQGVAETGKRLMLASQHQQVEEINAAELEHEIAVAIAGMNPAGLCDPLKRNLYPFG